VKALTLGWDEYLSLLSFVGLRSTEKWLYKAVYYFIIALRGIVTKYLDKYVYYKYINFEFLLECALRKS